MGDQPLVLKRMARNLNPEPEVRRRSQPESGAYSQTRLQARKQLRVSNQEQGQELTLLVRTSQGAEAGHRYQECRNRKQDQGLE